MPRVLVLSYYFPPMGGVEVQRVTRFVRHLPGRGWQPVVVSTRGGFHTSWDHARLRDLPSELSVVRVRAPEHGPSVRRTERLAQGADVEQRFRDSRRLGDRLARRLEAFDRRYLCFPDEKNWWALAALLPAMRELRKCQADVVLATGFPWSTLALGARLSRLTGVPLVVDMRDSWTTDPRGWWSSPRHRRLERQVFEAADQIVCATDTMRVQYEQLYLGLSFRTVHNACADPDEDPRQSSVSRRDGSPV